MAPYSVRARDTAVNRVFTTVLPCSLQRHELIKRLILSTCGIAGSVESVEGLVEPSTPLGLVYDLNALCSRELTEDGADKLKEKLLFGHYRVFRSNPQCT